MLSSLSQMRVLFTVYKHPHSKLVQSWGNLRVNLLSSWVCVFNNLGDSDIWQHKYELHILKSTQHKDLITEI